MSTNGYTIRLDLLKMAKEMLEQEWYAERDQMMSEYHNKIAFAHAKAESAGFQNSEFPESPKFRPFPSEDQIIAKARVLNEFINQKS